MPHGGHAFVSETSEWLFQFAQILTFWCIPLAVPCYTFADILRHGTRHVIGSPLVLSNAFERAVDLPGRERQLGGKNAKVAGDYRYIICICQTPVMRRVK